MPPPLRVCLNSVSTSDARLLWQGVLISKQHSLLKGGSNRIKECDLLHLVVFEAQPIFFFGKGKISSCVLSQARWLP